MKLYRIEACPYCKKVRRKLDSLDLDYEEVDVPKPHSEREEIYELSGQRAVPVLVDGEEVVNDSERIVSFLDERYGD